MKEIIIETDLDDPIELLGVNDSKLRILRENFPLVSIVSRGQQIKLQSEDDSIHAAKEKIIALLEHIRLSGQLREDDIEQIFSGKELNYAEINGSDGLILNGRDNKAIRARTPNQLKLVKAVRHNDIVFATGPAGTGKTFTSVALAVKALKNKEVKKIILTRPAVEAGENLGFLPGDMREKIDPYLRPLYDALDAMLPSEKMGFYIERKIIEIAPLAFMRGRTLDEAFVILDEAQNCSDLQLKMFLTRMGPSAKFVVNGDLTQIDLPSVDKSGLFRAVNLLSNIKGIGVVEFDVNDVTRHRLVKDIIKAYAKKKKTNNTET